MTPALDTGFAARVSARCPGFRALDSIGARKSCVLAGELDGLPVVAKALARPNPVWAWYLAREVAMYRAFAASPPPLRVPRLIFADDDLLVIERLVGAPVGARRRPAAALPAPMVHALVAITEAFAGWSFTGPGTAPATAPPPRVRSQLRARLLEDPTAPVAWVRDGVAACVRRGILPRDAAAQIDAAIAADPRVAPAHGDLLLRNVIAAPDGGLGLVDWECAGPHLVDWDRALLWTQLAPASRGLVEAAAQTPAFRGLVAFALAREIAFLRVFRVPARHAGLLAVTAELADACRRLQGGQAT